MTREEMIAQMREWDEEERRRAEATAPASTAPASDIERMREDLRANAAGREPEAWYEDLGEGIVSSGLDTYYGLKDLVTDLTPEETARMKDWERDAGESGWGTAGRVLGEAAQLAIPGGAAVKGARALSALNKASKAAKALPMSTDIVFSGLHGAAQYQEPGDKSRLQRGLESAGAAVGGHVLGKALRPLTGRGSAFKISDEAQELMDKGVFLTPGQAAASPAIQGAEAVMEVTPIVARGTKAARARGQEEWQREALRSVVPKNMADDITEGGFAGTRQLSEAIDKGYDEAWGLADDLPSLKLPQKTINRLAKKDRKVVNNVLEDIELLREGGEVSGRQIDKIIRDALPTKQSKRELRNALKQLRDGYRSFLPPEQQIKLKQMDKSWQKFLSVRRAAKNAVLEGGEFAPAGLLRASNVIGRDALGGVGRAPMQRMGLLGQETVGRKVGGQPLEWFRRVAGITPTPWPMEFTGQFLMGQRPAQRRLAEMLRRPIETASPYISPARTAAAFEESD